MSLIQVSFWNLDMVVADNLCAGHSTTYTKMRCIRFCQCTLSLELFWPPIAQLFYVQIFLRLPRIISLKKLLIFQTLLFPLPVPAE